MNSHPPDFQSDVQPPGAHLTSGPVPQTVPAPQRFPWLFAWAGAALGSVVVFMAVGVRSYVSATHWVDHTLEVRHQVDDWLAALADAEAGARGYLATGNAVFLDPYEAARAREQAETQIVQELVADNARQAQNAGVAARDGRAVMGELEELVGLAVRGRREEAVARLTSGTAKVLMDAFRGDARRMLSEEERLLAERRVEVAARGKLTLAGAVLLSLGSFALLALAWRRERAHDAITTALAREARQRLKRLSGLAAALADARTQRQVGQAIIEQGMQAAGADTCTLYELDDDGETLNLIADSGSRARGSRADPSPDGGLGPRRAGGDEVRSGDVGRGRRRVRRDRIRPSPGSRQADRERGPSGACP